MRQALTLSITNKYHTFTVLNFLLAKHESICYLFIMLFLDLFTYGLNFYALSTCNKNSCYFVDKVSIYIGIYLSQLSGHFYLHVFFFYIEASQSVLKAHYIYFMVVSITLNVCLKLETIICFGPWLPCNLSGITNLR